MQHTLHERDRLAKTFTEFGLVLANNTSKFLPLSGGAPG